MDEAFFYRMLLPGPVKSRGWFCYFSEALIQNKKCKFLAVNVKHNRITDLCLPFFENWLAALYFPIRFLYSVWSAAGCWSIKSWYSAATHFQILQPMGNKRQLFL